MLYLRHSKNRGHYHTSNGILFTPYPTLHKLSVRISGMNREVRVELSDQSSRGGGSISINGNQPLRSKFLLIPGSSSSKTTFLSAHTNLRMFSFSYVSVFLTQKPLTIKRRSRRGCGCPMSSSLPNHDAKFGIGQTEKDKEEEEKKNKENPRANCIRHS